MIDDESKTIHSVQTEQGFTLVETCIAIVVLLFGLVSIVGMSAYISRANMVSNIQSVLATYGQDRVDLLRGAVWNKTTEDPVITVGGSLSINDTNHFALVTNTPAGDLFVRWKVTSGPGTTNDIRTITVFVTQTTPSSFVKDGFTMTTTLVKS
ncbi:MAG TPA: hypothetical protein VFV34_27360 [Blastocatellia bacterium]|nr:hypothetical protein [Blastocatellia bacterium]